MDKAEASYVSRLFDTQAGAVLGTAPLDAIPEQCSRSKETQTAIDRHGTSSAGVIGILHLPAGAGSCC